MLSSFLLFAAPILLVNPASAAPSQLIQLGAQENAVVECNAALPPPVTVTSTVYAASTSPARATTVTGSASSSSSSSTKALGTIMPSAVSPSPNGTSFGGLRNALYFTNWGIYGADYQPDRLPAKNLTHVLYAFADIASDGEVISSDAYADLQKHYDGDSWSETGNNAYGCVKQLFLLKKKHRRLKTLLSIGGWTYSPKIAPVAATDAGRRRFCSSAIDLMKDWGFDGLDIDWEYPANTEQGQHYVLLLRTCHQMLDAYAAKHAPGYRFLITIATSAGALNYNNLNFTGMDPYLDAWHLMTYDFAGSWDTTAGHQSNLFLNAQNPNATKFSADDAVRDYIKNGVPPKKIVLGIPLYGRTFESTDGPGQPYTGIGPGTVSYKDLPLEGAKEHYDNVSLASYSYDQTKRQFITYDNVRSAVTKSRYLLQRGLGGAVFWEASGDKAGNQSLVATVAKQMRFLERKQNLLSYPASRYDNIRAGLP